MVSPRSRIPYYLLGHVRIGSIRTDFNADAVSTLERGVRPVGRIRESISARDDPDASLKVMRTWMARTMDEDAIDEPMPDQPDPEESDPTPRADPIR